MDPTSIMLKPFTIAVIFALLGLVIWQGRVIEKQCALIAEMARNAGRMVIGKSGFPSRTNQGQRSQRD